MMQISVFDVSETNGINADYRVFLRTVHHTDAPGEDEQAANTAPVSYTSRASTSGQPLVGAGAVYLGR